jgi:hypothetical protein
VRRGDPAAGKLRARRRPLPVMAVVVVRLGWRQLPAGREARRGVARAGLWDFAPFRVSRHARSPRRRGLPAQLFVPLSEAALTRWPATGTRALPAAGSLPARFPARWAADGAARAARRHQRTELRQPTTPLGGKLRAVVALYPRRPPPRWDPAHAPANDKTVGAQGREAWPVGARVGRELGWFSVPCVAALPAAGKSCVTRRPQQTAATGSAGLGGGGHGRDALSARAASRAKPGRPRGRRGSGRWGTPWSQSLTHVRAPPPSRRARAGNCSGVAGGWRQPAG